MLYMFDQYTTSVVKLYLKYQKINRFEIDFEPPTFVVRPGRWSCDGCRSK